MERHFTNTNAREINRLWSEIYSLWKYVLELDGISDEHFNKANCNKAINIFSKILELVDKEKDPHDYCVALRMRAQNYCLLKKYDDALNDLHVERKFNGKNNDLLRVKKGEDLISQILVWQSIAEGNN